MRRFYDLPIKSKLTLIILLITGVALLLASAAFVTYEQIAFRREMARNLSISARMIGFNSSAALAFNDPGSAAQTLKGLSAQPHIMAACIYDTQGEVFATYEGTNAGHREWPKAPELNLERFGVGSLELFHRIDLDGEIIGTIYLQSDLDEIRTRWQRYGVMLGVILLATVLVAWWLAAKLQRVISGPILQLSSIAERVAAENDYSARAVKQSNDELGRMIDGFNHMLAQIQARDAALQRANDELESHVQERTAKLAEASGMLEAMLENSPDLIYFKDRESRFVRFSTAFLRRFKLNGVEELRGRTDFDLFSSEHARPAFDDEQEIIRTGKPINGKLEKETCLDGRVYWALTSKMLWRDRDGQIIGTFGISKDVSDRKDAEEKLEVMHQQLRDTARHAGMAEVATGVLHNVGNVLNSVNVSAHLITDNVRKSKVSNLGRVAALLAENAADPVAFLTNDPRGQQVPAYLGQLAQHLAEEQRIVVTEVEELRKNIEHIKEIVAMQQNYAKISGLAETIEVADLVEDAVKMNTGALARHCVELVRDYQDVPPIVVDKHKVLQILVNLIRNAKHACDDSKRTDKELRMRIRQDGDMVHIAVIDNGVGIPPENLTRIFSHGFTTKKTGHGFGLHSGAIAAKEMGGALLVSSGGEGRGATFTLTLPSKPKTSE